MISSCNQPTALEYLSNVLKLRGLTNVNIQLGPRSEDDETCDKSEYHKTVGSKSVNSHGPLQVTDDKLIS